MAAGGARRAPRQKRVWNVGRGTLTTLVVTLLVMLAGCDAIDGLLSDDQEDGPSSAPVADAPGDEVATEGAIDVGEPVIGPASANYVEGLCSVDPFAMAGEDDPLRTLADAYRSVETSSAEEAAELERIVAAIEDAIDRDDPEAFTDAASIVRARCAAVVVR